MVAAVLCVCFFPGPEAVFVLSTQILCAPAVFEDDDALIRLMEEILHHLGMYETLWITIKTTNWCRISSSNSTNGSQNL